MFKLRKNNNGAYMGKNNITIDAQLFKDDHDAANDQRIVIFISKQMGDDISKWQRKHKIRTRSTAIRFMLRCCIKHQKDCGC